MIDFIEAFQKVLAILDRLEITYYVGGSVASGNYGFPRQTNDIDIVANFQNVDLGEFCSLLEPEFYVDPERVREAVSRKQSFNAIHRQTVLKFDFFVAAQSDYVLSQMNRRRYVYSAIPGLEELEFAICSAEDAVLSKIRWYEMGGRVSDQQWKDILGIIAVQADKLDLVYLRQWAGELGLTDLLEEALSRALPSRGPERGPSSEPAD